MFDLLAVDYYTHLSYQCTKSHDNDDNKDLVSFWHSYLILGLCGFVFTRKILGYRMLWKIHVEK